MSTPVPGEDDRLSVRAALANESMESVLSIWSSTLPCRMLHSSAPWVACALASSIAFAAKAAGQLACVSSRGRCFYRQKGRCFSAPSFERLRDVSCCKVDPAPKFPAGFPSSREAFPAAWKTSREFWGRIDFTTGDISQPFKTRAAETGPFLPVETPPSWGNTLRKVSSCFRFRCKRDGARERAGIPRR